MHITRFIRDCTDVELGRLSRPGTLWDSMSGSRFHGEGYDKAPGCLMCNALNLRNATSNDWHGYVTGPLYVRTSAAVGWYYRFADRHGDAEAGALIGRLAWRELMRRTMDEVREQEAVTTTGATA